MLRESVIEIEKIILNELGYETFRLIETGHKYMISFMKTLKLS